MTGIILVMAVTAVAVAQVAFKTAVAPRRPLRLAATMALFALAQLGFFVALRSLEVGLVYMATGITHVLVLLLSWRWLGESIGTRHVVAGTLIVSGVIIYGLA